LRQWSEQRQQCFTRHLWVALREADNKIGIFQPTDRRGWQIGRQREVQEPSAYGCMVPMGREGGMRQDISGLDAETPGFPGLLISALQHDRRIRFGVNVSRDCLPRSKSVARKAKKTRRHDTPTKPP
jgi:hypothetical protein